MIAIKKKIEKLQSRLDSIAGGNGEVPASFALKTRKKHRMSRAGKARIAAAVRARWAKFKKNAKKGKRRLSAAGKAAIIAGIKARWARVRAGKKQAL